MLFYCPVSSQKICSSIWSTFPVALVLMFSCAIRPVGKMKLVLTLALIDVENLMDLEYNLRFFLIKKIA